MEPDGICGYAGLVGFLVPCVLGESGLKEPEAIFYVKQFTFLVSVFAGQPLSVGVALSAAYLVAGVGGLS
jgi:hypothetical protein